MYKNDHVQIREPMYKMQPQARQEYTIIDLVDPAPWQQIYH